MLMIIIFFLKNILGVACINAPIPPEETKLQLLYEPNSVIAFGDTVSYECLPGTFFEEDYNMPNFTLTCLTDGNFSDPLPWKNCLLPSSKPQRILISLICTIYSFKSNYDGF